MLSQPSQPVSSAAEVREAVIIGVNEVDEGTYSSSHVTNSSILCQLGNVQDALKPITEYVNNGLTNAWFILIHGNRLLTATHEDSVRLYCTVPTWPPSSDICMKWRSESLPHIIDTDISGIDLHDLNTLRSRSLHFIHDLVNSLRESGVRGRLGDNRSMTLMFLNLGPGLVQAHAVEFAVVPDLCVPVTSRHECNSTFSA